MSTTGERIIQTELGEGLMDREGAAVAVARLDVEKSYKDVGLLLQKVIRDGDEGAWREIKAKIHYTYENLDAALSTLEEEAPFLSRIRERLSRGQKLLFKPNLVNAEGINPFTHGPFVGTTSNTEWPFVAAVMRWFHDRAGVSYYQMSLGEAATCMSSIAGSYSHIKGSPVTTEAVIEGRSGEFYGGWGFYFVRKYLSEASVSSRHDDPMAGLEESMKGTYLPPGVVRDKLMVYDLNRICDDPSKGRDIPVPGGDVFDAIILHKVIVGGDPSAAEDRRLYPGCILINLPRLKVHTQALFTNAIKNLGIGLYPMEVSRSGGCAWEYATPKRTIPGLKGAIPHQVWIPEMDPETALPKRDANGEYVVQKTGGLTGTMIDIIDGVGRQDVFMMHIVDALEPINRDHQGMGLGAKEAEGLLVASLDPVATDLFCARYMFSNVGLKVAEAVGIDDGFGGRFPQAVPIPRHDGSAIITETGYDCPIRRDFCLRRAEERGLGVCSYHVVGRDGLTGRPLISYRGRLGHLEEGDIFQEIVTRVLYSAIYKMPWDLQRTFFGYLDAVDRLEGSALKADFLHAFDESGDGTVTYEEYGKKGLFGSVMILSGLYVSTRAEKDESEAYRAFFATGSTTMACSNPEWNPWGHDFSREKSFGAVAVVAQAMSQWPTEEKDPFVPGLLWGRGKWPSFSLASHIYLHQLLYGIRFPAKVTFPSLYGSAVAYADLTQNGRRFVGPLRNIPDTSSPQKYLDAVRDGQMKPLDFTFYVPSGFGGNGRIPNVKETPDPAKILTVEFENGRVLWPDLRLLDMEVDG
jgi:hypothetical protein